METTRLVLLPLSRAIGVGAFGKDASAPKSSGQRRNHGECQIKGRSESGKLSTWFFAQESHGEPKLPLPSDPFGFTPMEKVANNFLGTPQ